MIKTGLETLECIVFFWLTSYFFLKTVSSSITFSYGPATPKKIYSIVSSLLAIVFPHPRLCFAITVRSKSLIHVRTSILPLSGSVTKEVEIPVSYTHLDVYKRQVLYTAITITPALFTEIL